MAHTSENTAFTSFCSRSSVALQLQWRTYWGVGIAQWLERRTRVWKAVGLSHCMSGRRIFLSSVNFLCWLLFWYPFYPCVTAVACKRSWFSAKSAGGQVTAKHACTLCMWLCMKCHSAWLYGVHRTCRDGSSFIWDQPCQLCKYTTLVDIQKRSMKKLGTCVESHASATSLLESWEWHTEHFHQDLHTSNTDCAPFLL